MTSRTTGGFRRDLAALPAQVRQQAKDAYELFQSNPQHPSLKFKKLPPHDDIWSVRVSQGYRAVGLWRGDVIVWFFIGSHADYDRLIDRL